MFRLVVFAAVFLQTVVALNDTVNLGYASYRGTNLGNGVFRWAGMRYARSVSRVDGRRFTAPQDPADERNIVDASKFGPLCIGATSDLDAEFGEAYSEDCLFVNVFSPTKSTNGALLPVYIFIQGGGFNFNSNGNYDASRLIHAANDSIVVVNFNYRVGPYGFLASKELAGNKTFSLNNGLKDQRQAFKWVKKYISEFGGDPDHITIGGASAGGGSTIFHLTAYGGRDDKLFHAAAAESGAFPPLRNVQDSQWQYEALRNKTGCADLDCLASLDAVRFQTAVRTLKLPYPGGKDPPIFFWNPTLDYDFIQDFTANELKAGHYVKVPTIFGDTTHEGDGFTPVTITSLPSAQQFITDQFPTVNWRAIRSVWRAPIDVVVDSGWKTTASDVYGHIRYSCPNLNISATYSSNNPFKTWSYRWNVGTALHVAELGPIWNNATEASGVFIQAYWASFIRSYDPNKYPATFTLPSKKVLTSPNWEVFGKGNGRRILFSDNNDVKMETVSNDEAEKCSVVNSMTPQQKQVAATAANTVNVTTTTNLTAITSTTPKVVSLAGQKMPISSAAMGLMVGVVGLLPWLFT